MRDLPRKLTVEQLAELFEGRTALVEQLAEIEDPLGNADRVLERMSEEDKLEALDVHPAIGAKRSRHARQLNRERAPNPPSSPSSRT